MSETLEPIRPQRRRDSSLNLVAPMTINLAGITTCPRSRKVRNIMGRKQRSAPRAMSPCASRIRSRRPSKSLEKGNENAKQQEIPSE